MFESRDLPLSVFAGPVFVEECVVQDRVETLSKDFWLGLSLVESEFWFDKLVEFTISLWKLGLHECTQSYSLNYGQDAQGEVALFDYGEITTDLDVASKYIETKFYRTAWWFRSPREDQQELYERKASKYLTGKRLASLWR